MADRRMLSRTLMEALNECVSKDAQLLFMHAVLNTDEDGFVLNPSKLPKSLDLDPKALGELVDGGYIYLLTDDDFPGKPQVAVVRQWHTFNDLKRRDRYRENQHQSVIEQLYFRDNIYYTEKDLPKGNITRYRDFLDERKEKKAPQQPIESDHINDATINNMTPYDRMALNKINEATQCQTTV